jgi:hypothetical protein
MTPLCTVRWFFFVTSPALAAAAASTAPAADPTPPAPDSSVAPIPLLAAAASAAGGLRSLLLPERRRRCSCCPDADRSEDRCPCNHHHQQTPSQGLCCSCTDLLNTSTLSSVTCQLPSLIWTNQTPLDRSTRQHTSRCLC